MGFVDKRILNFLVIIILTFLTFVWSFYIFHKEINYNIISVVIGFRILTSIFILKDYSLSWSKSTPVSFLIKTIGVVSAFLISILFLYSKVEIYFLISEMFIYLFFINFFMFSYNYFINKASIHKTKSLIIYGAGRAGLKLEEEFKDTEYKIKCFIDDDRKIQNRSIDGIKVYSREEFLKNKNKNNLNYDLLLIAVGSASKIKINNIYDELNESFKNIKILPSIYEQLQDKNFTNMLKDITVEDLLARQPKDLDKYAIKSFINNKTILITGAGGSIGSEICRQCVKYNAKEIILLDHSEFNLYTIEQELSEYKIQRVMQSVVNKDMLSETFKKYKPQIVIHAAAYKHVPLVEYNIREAILNNIVGTKNVIDCSIENKVEKVVLISTDKAVRPTNVMGATKRICELYSQNVKSVFTEIVAVRFGNVLGSSGSVIPKFKKQIEEGGPVTVTHPDITRYFMLIPEACELVLQAASIGKGGEIFILDMGDCVKIVDLAKKMIELSHRDDIEIKFSGLRPGEKLYEELLIDEANAKTNYESIMIAGMTNYPIKELDKDIEDLILKDEKLKILKKIVPEFNHSI